MARRKAPVPNDDGLVEAMRALAAELGPDSPLLDKSKRDRTRDLLRAEIDDLDKEERREVLAEMRKIQARRLRTRKPDGT